MVMGRMMMSKNTIIRVLIFVGTLISMVCLSVFMFVTSSPLMSIMCGAGIINTLSLYDKYKEKNWLKNHP